MPAVKVKKPKKPAPPPPPPPPSAKKMKEIEAEELGFDVGVEGGVVGALLGSPACMAAHPPAFHTEEYQRIYDNRFLPAMDNPLSTFSIDVDTGAYSNVRRFLNNKQLPPRDAVRIEEMINYFKYSYPEPQSSIPCTRCIGRGPARLPFRIHPVGIHRRGTQLTFKDNEAALDVLHIRQCVSRLRRLVKLSIVTL
ncbi:MAG: hypothetical protein GY940_25130 [bacterium]|nr:hypothetical protein [bacterium]